MLQAVITRLKYEFFLPDDIIVREGTLGDKMYFIQEGLVEIYLEPTVPDGEPTVITHLSDGSYFGGNVFRLLVDGYGLQGSQ